MAAVLGKVNVFDPEHEEWPQYVERLDQFFEANDLTGDDKATKRRATFLTVIGPGPYKLLRSLISPAKPTDKTYGELVKKLTEHYSPTPSEVMQRFRFNSRSRRTEESVAAYMADLRRARGALQLRRYFRQDAQGQTRLGHQRCGHTEKAIAGE